MATEYGPWMGQGTQARIILDYTRDYFLDNTYVVINGSFRIQFNDRVNDDTNVYNIGGACVPQSGSKNYAFGAGGGIKELGTNWSFFAKADTNTNVYANADNILQCGNVKIIGNFTIPTGPLAPIIDKASSFYAATWGPRMIWAAVRNVNSNGGYITQTQVQWNTQPTDVGAPNKVGAYLTDIVIDGLAPATQYWFRGRVANDWYGWSAWSNWIPRATSADVPNAPSFGISSVSQLSAVLWADAVNNGSALTAFDIAVNTSQTLTGALRFGGGSLTGLMPNTLYYVAVRAANAIGWGPWSAWGSFQTKPSVLVQVNGVWKNAVPYVNVGGVWKIATRYVNVNGVWKE